MVEHPVQTLEGIGHVLAHPIDSGKAIGHAIKETGTAALHGDGRAIGTSLGTVGMLFVPGADVAEGAEDVARVGKLGEVGEAGDVALATRASEGASMAGKVLTPASLTAEIDALKAANAADVAGTETFVTYGVDNSSINRYLATGEGKQYIQQLRQADPLASEQALLDRAADQLSTGTSCPP